MTDTARQVMTTRLVDFDYRPRTRVIFGNNSVDRVGELVREYGGATVLLVTDPGIEEAGHHERVRQSLEAAGLKIVLFDKVIANPTTREVDACVEVAKAGGVDFIVGLGGGSSMDTAKGCNFILTNGGRMQDYWGVGKASKPMLPLIAIPTTAGTGSECQSFALISKADTHEKMACGDPKAAAKVAILDPVLTLTQPESVAACTGIDAISHALETSVTKKRNALSTLFSREAFKLCSRALAKVIEEPDDLEARGRMLLGAAYAGTAIENSMLGAAHSLANPLTAHFDVIHGQAVGIMLPTIVRFNSRDPEIAKVYADLAVYSGLASNTDTTDAAVDALVSHIEYLLDVVGFPRSLKEYGVEESIISTLANEASGQWTAQFNPRAVEESDFQSCYEGLLSGRGDGSPPR